MNFVSEGTIEQGMLSLLSFKKALHFFQNWMGQDEKTQIPYFKLPIPKPETVQKIAQFLGEFANTLRRN